MGQAKSALLRLIEGEMGRRGIRTQKELSEETGVHRSVVSRLFCGRSMSADNAYQLLESLDLLRESGEAHGTTDKTQSLRIDCLDRRAHTTYYGQFANKDLAIRLSNALLELEQFGEDHLLDVERDIATRLRTLRLQGAPTPEKKIPRIN